MYNTLRYCTTTISIIRKGSCQGGKFIFAVHMHEKVKLVNDISLVWLARGFNEHIFIDVAFPDCDKSHTYVPEVHAQYYGLVYFYFSVTYHVLVGTRCSCYLRT